MSLLHELQLIDEQISELNSKREKLMSSESFKKEAEFHAKLTGLMGEYGRSLKDIIKIFGTEEKQAPARRVRAEKTFKNPHTGEVVTVKSINNGQIKEWKAKWGQEAVMSWLQ
ncbi:hypothetical protein SAMN05216178_6840 [Pseudomonas saponiphila]|jgi:hypothetical protein|uniref:MvaT DNA-binding domain-containing protein n=1 Tax=Pseudomonas saponiphila TaxID=556534 RepID=A0A1H4ZUJ1_9PSED|nr:histone-like nucleoid-structuring protein, MvaT/MvaU family [Pseudomonas saponiphila]SED33762.1 hypothetical protein SAMN05216178_6840 [Pseudomonas saponiphila]